MKKFAIYGLSALLGVAFVACDNYEEPNPQPQTNAQGIVLQADQVTVTNALAEGQAYDLAAINAAGEAITTAQLTAPDLGEYYSYKAVVEMSNDNFAHAYEVPATVAATETQGVYAITVTPDDLQGVYYAHISKGPKTKDVQLRYKLYTVSNGDNGVQTARIGNDETVYGPYNMSVTPFPSELVIEDNYYLVGTACDWTISAAIKLNHSDLSPYDDPVFTAKFDVFEGWWWKIIPESTFVTGDWAQGPNTSFGVEVNGDESLGGVLVAATETTDPEAGCLNVSGPYLLTINMEDLTYQFDLTIENLYTPGNSNGWSQTASQMLYTDDYTTYMGYAYLDGEFKFSTEPNWDGTNYGAADAEGALSTDGGAGNLNAGAAGLYWLTANIANLTYTATNITTIGVIGDATAGGWDASTALTPSADFLTWSGVIKFNGSGEFKFRCNDAWDVNLGGALNDLKQGGDNIATPGEGEYKVVLDLSTLPYNCTITK